MAIEKLILIKYLIGLGTKTAIAQAIAIMYTLAASGTQRVFSINRQLESLNLTLGS
jgi:hypothetical protein